MTEKKLKFVSQQVRKKETKKIKKGMKKVNKYVSKTSPQTTKH